MSNSRQKIFERIKQANLPPSPKSELNFTKLTFENPYENFSKALQSVGGSCTFIQREEELKELLKFPAEAKILSALNSIPDQNVNRQEIINPHAMNSIDYCCFHAELAVAENGAILTYCEDFLYRSVYFLAQHLIVTVDAKTILNNMHEAYEKITTKPFAIFISGPSKTADIEQSLVIGAHGAKSLQVFVVGNI